MVFDDFAIMSPQAFEQAIKEYKAQTNKKNLKILIQQDSNDITNLQKKLQYLQKLLYELKDDTKNKDVLSVIEQITNDTKFVIDSILKIANPSTETQSVEKLVTTRFCNNLKLAIQTCGEIVKLMVKIKDDVSTSGENKLLITTLINKIVDINNNLVSLFGECKYRGFLTK